jgi:hypothetical protein
MADALRSPTCGLSSLDLSACQLASGVREDKAQSAAAWGALAGSLAENASLAELNLAHCGIPAAALPAFAEALARNGSLTALDLSGCDEKDVRAALRRVIGGPSQGGSRAASVRGGHEFAPQGGADASASGWSGNAASAAPPAPASAAAGDEERVGLLSSQRAGGGPVGSAGGGGLAEDSVVLRIREGSTTSLPSMAPPGGQLSVVQRRVGSGTSRLGHVSNLVSLKCTKEDHEIVDVLSCPKGLRMPF